MTNYKICLYSLKIVLNKIHYLPGCNVSSRITNSGDVDDDLSSIISLNSG